VRGLRLRDVTDDIKSIRYQRLDLAEHCDEKAKAMGESPQALDLSAPELTPDLR
jgi:hypothetical protein